MKSDNIMSSKYVRMLLGNLAH